MATLTITIEMDNAAFDDYPGEEAIRILREAAGRLESVGVEHHAGELFTLYDVNGNTVGSVVLS